jgi:Domain of Unknown Function with PDB structure (DUF3857)
MKKIILALSCCVFLSAFSQAQDFPDYGILHQEDINLKACDFDKDATAVVLLHEAYSNYDESYHLITYHHVRIKILKDKGKEAANVSIPFYRKDDFEQISRVEGMTINTFDESQVTSKLDRKSIFTKNTNEQIGEVVFTFPDIKVGSVIEYKYVSTMKNYGGLNDWNFQEEFPVIDSKYNLVIVPNAEFAYRVNKNPNIPISIKKEPNSGTIDFEMKNIPGLANEPYMDCRRDYLQKIIFQLSGYVGSHDNKEKYMTSWDEVTRELLSAREFGSQLTKSIPGTDNFIKQIDLLVSPEEKMKSIFNYVRGNMSWNNVYSKYSESAKNAWDKKSGTSGDINLILINLLKSASLEVYPMLVSERFHGKVQVDYPFIDQFNSVFACVTINNKRYYLDATDKTIPEHLTPFNILNTTAFVVNRKSGGLVNITNDTTQYLETILARLDLSKNGVLAGDVSVRSFDYARIKKLQEYTTDNKNFLSTYFHLDGTSIEAKDLEVSNVNNDSMPFEQSFKIEGNLASSGGYTFIPMNFFTGFDVNPFLSDNRFSNINFGYKRTINLDVAVDLPEGYSVDELPKSVRLSDPDKDIVYTRQVDYDKSSNSVNFGMQFVFNKSVYESDMYSLVKQMYQKIFDYLKEPIVLKKNN